MKSLKKHSNFSAYNVALLISFLLFLSCSKQEENDRDIVKINEAALTESSLDSALGAKENYGKVREEYISDWIEKEILFQQAVKDGITDDKKFLSILKKSKKELATAFLLNKLIEGVQITTSEEEINEFYNSHLEDFKTPDDLFRLNISSTNEFEKAVNFRQKVLSIGWSIAAINARQDSTLSIIDSKLYYKYQLQPVTLFRLANNLNPDEVSTVFESEPGNFIVIQLLEKFTAGTVLPINLARDNVKKQLEMIKQKEIIKQYIKKMISDHNVEVKRYSE